MNKKISTKTLYVSMPYEGMSKKVKKKLKKRGWGVLTVLGMVCINHFTPTRRKSERKRIDGS
jgi:hypothetical protein